MRYILYGLLAYFLFRLIFNFIVPVYKTTQKVKKGFREMNEKMNDHVNSNQANDSDAEKNKPAPKVGEYIDFEEVKK